MELDAQVLAALVAAATSVVVLGIEKTWSFLRGRREQRRQTQIQYLYPLKLACDDLLEYWYGLLHRSDAELAKVSADFLALRDSCGATRFHQDCNDYLCGPAGTLYATACYFARAARFREELPLVRVRQRRALALLQGVDAVRSGLGSGDQGAFWIEVQDNIGCLVSKENGHVIPYGRFCEALCSDHCSYFKLFNFYIDVRLNRDHQLRRGYDALLALQRLLGRILEAPPVIPGQRTRHFAAPAKGAAAERAAAVA